MQVMTWPVNPAIARTVILILAGCLALTVMAGLDPAIRLSTVLVGMAGTDPTVKRPGGS
jgi:hypothetical protein